MAHHPGLRIQNAFDKGQATLAGNELQAPDPERIDLFSYLPQLVKGGRLRNHERFCYEQFPSGAVAHFVQLNSRMNANQVQQAVSLIELEDSELGNELHLAPQQAGPASFLF